MPKLLTVRTHLGFEEARSHAWFRAGGREMYFKAVFMVRDKKGRPTRERDYVFTSECPSTPILPEKEQ